MNRTDIHSYPHHHGEAHTHTHTNGKLNNDRVDSPRTPVTVRGGCVFAYIFS